jgi:hypothetical protein
VIPVEVRPLARRASAIMFEVGVHARTSSVWRIHRLGASLLVFRGRLRLVGALLLAAACGGCAAFSPDGGMGLVNGIVAPEFKSVAVKVNGEDVAGEAHARAARLLGATLTAQSASPF